MPQAWPFVQSPRLAVENGLAAGKTVLETKKIKLEEMVFASLGGVKRRCFNLLLLATLFLKKS